MFHRRKTKTLEAFFNGEQTSTCMLSDKELISILFSVDTGKVIWQARADNPTQKKSFFLIELLKQTNM